MAFLGQSPFAQDQRKDNHRTTNQVFCQLMFSVKFCGSFLLTLVGSFMSIQSPSISIPVLGLKKASNSSFQYPVIFGCICRWEGLVIYIQIRKDF